MAILKAKKLPFGISCCYTSQNYKVIGSEEYFDQMCEMGAKFAWFFTYMPVGEDAVTDLMVTPEQRRYVHAYTNSERPSLSLPLTLERRGVC